VSPCYPYRYKYANESDADYATRLADELEQEIIRVGPNKVAAFFAETSTPNFSSASFSDRVGRLLVCYFCLQLVAPRPAI